MARARCAHTLSKLDWLDESAEPGAAVREATEEMLHGTLRNNRGTVRRNQGQFLFKLTFKSFIPFRNSSAT